VDVWNETVSTTFTKTETRDLILTLYQLFIYSSLSTHRLKNIKIKRK
jgi:hypothetical protein